MNSNYGNYIPTGVLSSPGLYNESAWAQGWLPSWANLQGGIMGPLYTPAIRDPAVVEAIRRGSWDFTTEGTMFDPQGNYDLVPGAIPMHRYSGRAMTWHGADGGDYGADMELAKAPIGTALMLGAIGAGIGYYWGIARRGRSARADILLGASAGALAGFLLRSRPASFTPSNWLAWVSEMPAAEKAVYLSALGGTIYLAATKFSILKALRLPAVAGMGRKVRKNRGRRSNPKVRKGKRKGQPWSGQYGTGFQARYSSRSYRKRHNRRSRR